MKIHPITIHFFPKKKTNSTQYALYMRISQSKLRCDLTLKYPLDKNSWDPKLQRLKGRHPDQANLLGLMNQYRQRALTIYQEKIQLGLSPTPNDIKQVLNGVVSTSTGEPQLIELFEEVILRKQQLSGEQNSPATIQKYKRCKTHVELFLKITYHRSDITFDLLNLKFIEDFEIYLKTKGKCQHNSAMKYIQTLRGIFKNALSHGYAKSDPFAKYKIRLQEVVRGCLNETEIHQLATVSLPSEKLCKVRDLFIFSCYTGLAYADVLGLKGQNLQKEQGRYWIRARRQKTHVITNIPLLDIPKNILLKYNEKLEQIEDGKSLFQVMSNQKINDYLKIIAMHCGISKTLTFHLARHSFATTVTLSNGVPLESVSAMLGHKRIVTTQHYAKMVDKKLEEDMMKLQNRLNTSATDH